MITARALAWDFTQPGIISVHNDARRHFWQFPATVTTHRIKLDEADASAKGWPRPYEITAEIFHAPRVEAVCIIPPNAPEWAEDVIAQSFSHDGKPLRKSQEVTP